MIGSSFRTRSFCRSRGRRAASRSTSTDGCSGIRYPMELGSDRRRQATLHELYPLVRHKTERAGVNRSRVKLRTVKLVEERAPSGRGSDQPQRLFWELKIICRTTRSWPPIGHLADWYARRSSQAVSTWGRSRDARDDGAGHAVCDRGEVRPSDGRRSRWW